MRKGTKMKPRVLDVSQEEGLTSTEELASLRALKASLIRAYRQSKYCDITIKSKDGEEVLAHKVLLATQCPYFSRHLDRQTELTELKVEVSGVALKLVVEYIYSGKMKVNQVTKENAKDILTAGELFDIEVVREEAGMVMAKNLDIDNAVDVMTKDVFVGAVSNNAFTFVGQNFQTFLDSEHLKKRLINELGVGQICHLLSQKSLMLWDKKSGLYLPALEREKQLFFFVMSYVAHDKAARLPDLDRLLTCLKLPVLAVGKVLNCVVMAAGLKEKPEELSGQLAQVLEPFEALTGTENLATAFTDRGSRSQAERRMLVDTCKMRYATIPHLTTCSDLAPAANPYAGKQSFCPLSVDKRVEGQIVKSITVLRADMGAEEGIEDGVYRVCGIRLKMDDKSEPESLGMVEHPTMREEEYTLEEGEFITQVTTHHLKTDLQKGESFRKCIFSLTNISDLSFTTNKKRTLGPSPTEDGDPTLGPGLILGLPTKLLQLEKNCPGPFHWLVGFGMGTVKLSDTRPKTSLFPIWKLQSHFKVYPVKSQTFEFVSGVRKHYQFSVNGVSECSSIDDQEDIEQAERSPVHEVVDLEDSESENDDSEEDMELGVIPRHIGSSSVGGADDSVMVVDSDSEEDYDEEDEDEDDDEDRVHPSFRPRAGWPNGTKGGADEPIEIESSSDEEQEDKREKEKNAKKEIENNGKMKKRIEEAALKVNGGDPNLNLSEDSSENDEDVDSSEKTTKTSNESIETDQEKAKKRKLVTDAKDGMDEAKKSSVS